MSRFRHEYKYFLNAVQEQILLPTASGVLMRDSHVDESGTYLIRSLYFDNICNSCYYENENGTDPRSKFRIRYYGKDTGRIQLEKKSKVRGMTYKEMCLLTREECETLVRGDYTDLAESSSGTKQRLILEMKLRGMLPKVIVTYERIPFVYPGGNVRVTFDRMLTSSDDVEHFLTGEYRQRPVFPTGTQLLEVKWDEVLPLHIKEILQMDSLQWISFSKYFMCRVHHL